jgi:hypothetical protein
MRLQLSSDLMSVENRERAGCAMNARDYQHDGLATRACRCPRCELEVGFCEQVHTGGCSAAGCTRRRPAELKPGATGSAQ